MYPSHLTSCSLSAAILSFGGTAWPKRGAFNELNYRRMSLRRGALPDHRSARSFDVVPLCHLQARIGIACTRVGHNCEARFPVHFDSADGVSLINTGIANILPDVWDAVNLLAR